MMEVKRFVWLMAICATITACGGGKQSEAERASEDAHVQQGIAVADSDDPNKWAPSDEAVAKAKAHEAAPPIKPTPNPDFVPTDEYKDENDMRLGGIEKLPPPPMPPKIAEGDEADQYGLPAWEKLARGELHVKRIRY